MGKLKQHGLSDFADEVGRRGMLLDTNIDKNLPVTGLTFNPHKAGPGTLFVCKGADFKQEHLQSALDRGAICYVSEIPYEVKLPGADSLDERPYAIIVKDIQEVMPVLAAMFYCKPWEEMTAIGVGGIKGKSTAVHFLKSIIDEFMRESGGKDSIAISDMDTTPDAMFIQEHMRNVADEGIGYINIEVSADAFKGNCVDEIELDYGVFMNVSEEDFESNMKLFEVSDTAVVNLLSEHIDIVAESAKASRRLVTFGVENDNGEARQAAAICGLPINFCASDIRKNDAGYTFTVVYDGQVEDVPESFSEDFTVISDELYNVENALGAIAAATCMGIPREYIWRGIRNEEI